MYGVGIVGILLFRGLLMKLLGDFFLVEFVVFLRFGVCDF